MKNKAISSKLKTLSIALLLFMVYSVANAQEINNQEPISTENADEILNLVQNSNSQTSSSPASGTIILPDSLITTPSEEKKCMTVCARWGEDCTYINRGTGGMTRSCRRTCQQFTEECF